MTTSPIALSYPMSDGDMQAFLQASCGVETCDIKAQALFDAATSSTPAVWQSIRTELQLDFQREAQRNHGLEALPIIADS